MKTPEEIKKRLEGCKDKANCEWCNLIDQCERNADALAYIEQLEAGIDHAEKVAMECAKSITENLDKLQAKLFQLESDNESKQKRIEELESRLAQVERERDAAVHDLKLADRVDCDFCKHQYGGCTYDGCQDCSKPCPCGNCRNSSNYEWRGVCAENTEEEQHG